MHPSETLTVRVAADADAVLAAIDRQAAAEPFAGVEVLARGPRERVYGLCWQPRPGAEARIVWDLRVAETEDGTLLSSTRSVMAEDAARIHATAERIAGTALRGIKRAAERELRLVA